jgi:hypothetical protein
MKQPSFIRKKEARKYIEATTCLTFFIFEDNVLFLVYQEDRLPLKYKKCRT